MFNKIAFIESNNCEKTNVIQQMKMKKAFRYPMLFQAIIQ